MEGTKTVYWKIMKQMAKTRNFSRRKERNAISTRKLLHLMTGLEAYSFGDCSPESHKKKNRFNFATLNLPKMLSKGKVNINNRNISRVKNSSTQLGHKNLISMVVYKSFENNTCKQH